MNRWESGFLHKKALERSTNLVYILSIESKFDNTNTSVTTTSYAYFSDKPPKRISEVFTCRRSGRSCSDFITFFVDCCFSGNGNDKDNVRDAESSSSSSSPSIIFSEDSQWLCFSSTKSIKKGIILFFCSLVSAPNASSRFGTAS